MHSILEMEAQQPEFTRSTTPADREPFLRNRVELLPGSENGLREYAKAAMAPGRAHRSGASPCLCQDTSASRLPVGLPFVLVFVLAASVENFPAQLS
jgi:hypothetical protein